jgi:DNA-binding transcriptional LysR family regulator
VPDPTITYQLAADGAGIALISQLAAQRDVEKGRLVRLLPDWEPEPVDLHAVYSVRLNSSPKVRAFLEFLRERAGADNSLPGKPVRAGSSARPPQFRSQHLTSGHR